MFYLNRICLVTRFSASGFHRMHYRFVHIQLARCRHISAHITCGVPLPFNSNRAVWTTPHILNQLSIGSTERPPDINPCLWAHNNQLTPQNTESRSPESTSLAGEPTANSGGLPDKENKDKKEIQKGELSRWQKFKNIINHYYTGFRLLALEIRIACGICYRLLRGHSLTRRERKQLVRTVADIFRMVPFAVFIIVPFMEFLLPFYVKFFPSMLPSPFRVKSSETEKIQQRLKAKLELTRFLQETLHHTTGASSKNDGSLTVSEFQTFLDKVQESGIPPTNEEIMQFSKLFEDQITLDSLQTKQLKMLCQLLSLSTIGLDKMLRFRIWMRVRQLKAEDRLLVKEGVSQIPSWELQSLCQARGMRSVGLTEERLRSQLSEWLALHLEQNVPVTLLLFSRALHVSKASAAEISLKDAIAQLPTAASEEVAALVLESTPRSDVDPATKIEVLKKEQASIKAARVQRQQELADEKSTISAEAKLGKTASEVLKDTAPQLVGLPNEDLESQQSEASSSKAHKLSTPAVGVAAQDVSEACPSCAPIPDTAVAKAHEDTTEISMEDLAQIESAIATSSNALHEEAFKGLKEEVAETAKMREQHEADLVASERVVDKRTSKAASRLSSKLDRMIGEMDHMIEKLSDERQQLLKDIELREVHAKHSSEPVEKVEIIDAIKADHQRVVDINDLLLALRRIQKVPDDARWQRILDVLDEDHDGKIELQHVLSVIELLATENVKLSSKEVKRVLETLDNEELIEQVDSSAGDTQKPLLSSKSNSQQPVDKHPDTLSNLSSTSKPTGDNSSQKTPTPK